MAETPAVGDAGLLRLLTWLSPAFPVGAFAWSHGLEAAIAEGRVRDGEDVFAWIAFLLERGSGWNDLLLLRDGWRGETGEAATLGAALAGSRERRAETLALGMAFDEASAPWHGDGAATERPYPVAVGATAAAGGIALDAALLAYASAFCGSLLAAATRLVPLGQREATRILHRLEPRLLAAAARAAEAGEDAFGSAAILSDIAAMRHETLTTRLFRS